MPSLRIVELAADGKALILALDVAPAIDNGERYTLPIDKRLRAASHGDLARIQQSEIDWAADPLSPREIQTRIRAGESVAQLAAESGIQAERVERYAYPVLQERSRMADEARTAQVRLRLSQPAAPLAEFVAERLAVIGATSTVVWDACRPGGRWEIRLAWRADQKSGSMVWEYNPDARSVTPLDAETSDFAEGTPPQALGADGQTFAESNAPMSLPTVGHNGAERGHRGPPAKGLPGDGNGLSVNNTEDPESDARA